MKLTAADQMHLRSVATPVTAEAAAMAAPASKAASSQRAVARLAPTAAETPASRAAGTATAALAEVSTELHCEPDQKCVGLATTAPSEVGQGLLLEMAPVASVCSQEPLETSSVLQDLRCPGSGQHSLLDRHPAFASAARASPELASHHSGCSWYCTAPRLWQWSQSRSAGLIRLSQACPAPPASWREPPLHVKCCCWQHSESAAAAVQESARHHLEAASAAALHYCVAAAIFARRTRRALAVAARHAQTLKPQGCRHAEAPPRQPLQLAAPLVFQPEGIQQRAYRTLAWPLQPLHSRYPALCAAL